MKNLKGRAVFAQSGGPTAVINASVAGGIIAALDSPYITGVLCANHGVKGVLNEDFFDMNAEDRNEIFALKNTPASAFGSVRYKLKDFTVDDTDYKRVIEVFKKYDVHYFFYAGGNDSMDTCDKISRYAESVGYPVNVIGIPKTIDNDLVGTDHCPGYGSAAKYVAQSVAEVALDASVYDSPLVIIVEIMGRNAGWLTAAASLASLNGSGADLIYLPEVTFDNDKFIADVKRVVDKKQKCVVAVSEGIRHANGKYVGEDASATDIFGHSQLGGVCGALKTLVNGAGIKCKAIELNILQRCAAHCASATDIKEAFNAGEKALNSAINGETGKMVTFIRKEGNDYDIEYGLSPLTVTANAEKKIPPEWITESGTMLNEKFTNYALPLIAGEPDARRENGLISFAKLRLKKFRI
ncbi:MAG: 6-phosphofructokinase [Clostridia bacterium]|nr:6-phosphofructokinase [Clostridia bacterium]